MVGSRRDEILSIAAVQFAERGVASTTVRDIGAAAGILSGSLYHHFDSKEQMVAELLLPVMHRQVAHYRSIVGRLATATDVTAGATMRALIDVAVNEAAGTPHETRMIRNDAQAFSAMPTLHPVTELLVESAKLWATVIHHGVAAGEFRDDVDARLVVAAMFDAVLSTPRWFSGARRRRPEAVGAALANLFLGGLVASSG